MSIENTLKEILEELRGISSILVASKSEESNSNFHDSAPLLPISAWVKKHEWPTKGMIYQLIFWEKENGFSSCYKRVGRKILIDEKAIFEWMKTNPEMKGKVKK